MSETLIDLIVSRLELFDLNDVHPNYRANLRNAALAVIGALRKPTQSMLDAPTWYDGDKSFTPGDAEEVWHQMIDAA